MANLVYSSFKEHVLNGDIDLSSANVYLMLVSGAYTFSHTHEVTGDISSQIVSSNYTAGGKLIRNTSVAVDAGNDAVLDGDNLTFSGLTCSLAYGVVWVSGGSPSTSYLLGQVDFGNQTLTNSDFVVNWNSEGIFNLM